MDIPNDSFRVFCPAHDQHAARYHIDRPMADDSCPRCELIALRESLDPRTLMAVADMVERSDIHKAADIAERLRVIARRQFAARMTYPSTNHHGNKS